MAKNIEMNYLTDSGYEVLYPSNTFNNVIGNLDLSRTTGSLNISSRTTGNLPVSRCTGALPTSGGTMTGPLYLSGNPT